MTRASVRVRDERGDFSITVCAENLRRAVEFAARRYPGHAVGLRFPLDPEMFFVAGPAAGTETAEFCAAKGSQQERDLDQAAETPAARRRWGYGSLETATLKAAPSGIGAPSRL
jgi:hypothetical protein